jgi:hypothetical protein
MSEKEYKMQEVGEHRLLSSIYLILAGSGLSDLSTSFDYSLIGGELLDISYSSLGGREKLLLHRAGSLMGSHLYYILTSPSLKSLFIRQTGN